MALTEQDRIKLYRHFEADMGEDLATRMMDSLPPAGWGDLATKQDIESLRVATKQDIEDLRVATKQGIDHLRVATKQDIDHLRVATKQDIDHLREVLDLRFESVATKAELHKALRAQLLAIVMVMPVIQAMTQALSRRL